MELKDQIKEEISLREVFALLKTFGGEPDLKEEEGKIISRTICHNPPFTGKYKLYYRQATKSFTCFTDCGETFDIYTLIMKVKNTNKEYKEDVTKDGKKYYRQWNMYDAFLFLKEFLGTTETHCQRWAFEEVLSKEWEVLNQYEIKQKKSVITDFVIPEKPNEIKFYPFREFYNWKKEGIRKETLLRYGIKYDPIGCSILIPHYDINNRLIGIRQRTLVKEREKFGKYCPAMISSTDFSHPLSFNLYGLNQNKKNIQAAKKAIVFEGEKSVLMMDSYLGYMDNISVATCGSSFKLFKLLLLLSLGVEEIVIAFDRQYQIPDYKNYSVWIKTKDGEEYLKWMKKLIEIKRLCKPYCRVTFLIDKKGEYLGYKDSPIDKGIEIFKKLFNKRREHL